MILSKISEYNPIIRRIKKNNFKKEKKIIDQKVLNRTILNYKLFNLKLKTKILFDN